LQEQLERLVGDAIFGEVQKQSGGFGRECLAAFGVFSEQFSQGQFFGFVCDARRGLSKPGVG
jgi:hypothetical protein